VTLVRVELVFPLLWREGAHLAHALQGGDELLHHGLDEEGRGGDVVDRADGLAGLRDVRVRVPHRVLAHVVPEAVDGLAVGGVRRCADALAVAGERAAEVSLRVDLAALHHLCNAAQRGSEL